MPDHGEITYHVVIEPAGARVAAGPAAGPAAAPDVTIITDYETARALHAGEQTAQAALAAGRYKVRGRLVSLRTLAELEDVFAAVRARTTFP